MVSGPALRHAISVIKEATPDDLDELATMMETFFGVYEQLTEHYRSVREGETWPEENSELYFSATHIGTASRPTRLRYIFYVSIAAHGGTKRTSALVKSCCPTSTTELRTLTYSYVSSRWRMCNPGTVWPSWSARFAGNSKLAGLGLLS